MYRILGFDHGRKSGLAIVEDGKYKISWNYELEHKEYADRLDEFYHYARKQLLKHKPDLLCIEKAQDMTNAVSARQLIGYYSVLLLLGKQLGIETLECHPMTVKKVIAGNGRADKEMMVQTLISKYNIPIEHIKIPVYYKKKGMEGQIKEYLYDGSDAVGLAFYGLQYKDIER